MNRRDALKTGLGGLVGAALTLRPAFAEETTGAAPAAVAPGKLADAALKHFLADGRTCGEAILLAGAEALGVESELIPDVAFGLAGGIGLQGATCGVVTGSALVLGLRARALGGDDKGRLARAKDAAGSFYREFAEEVGATDCRQICGLDLTTPEGRQELKQRVKATRCAEAMRTGAMILGRLLSGPVE